MARICDTCHWRVYGMPGYPDEPKILSNGKPFGCCNLDEPGCEYWDEHGEAPKTCAQYCKEGEYKPTGMWAGLAKVVKEVAAITAKREG